MGRFQDNSSPRSCASGSEQGLRICLRKGCGRTYEPRHWNQRYCQDSECLKQVRRWQAAKRQQQRRKRPEVRQQRAASERQRRARQREQRSSDDSGTADRSHVDNRRDSDSAWSRTRRNSAPFCDRVGCYEKLRCCLNGQARYCDDDCRRGMSRARDRERKWLARKTLVGQFKRHLEYQARRAASAAQRGQMTSPAKHNLNSHRADTVVNSRDPAKSRLPCRDSKRVSRDDRKTHTDRGPRPPPSW